MSEQIEKKLKNALEIQKSIEDKIKFLEENSDELTDKQLESLAEAVIRFEESLSPEIDSIFQEMENNKNKILDPENLKNNELKD